MTLQCAAHSVLEGQVQAIRENTDFLVEAERERAKLCAGNCERLNGIDRELTRQAKVDEDQWKSIHAQGRLLYAGLGIFAVLELVVPLLVAHWLRG